MSNRAKFEGGLLRVVVWGVGEGRDDDGPERVAWTGSSMVAAKEALKLHVGSWMSGRVEADPETAAALHKALFTVVERGCVDHLPDVLAVANEALDRARGEQ